MVRIPKISFESFYCLFSTHGLIRDLMENFQKCSVGSSPPVLTAHPAKRSDWRCRDRCHHPEGTSRLHRHPQQRSTPAAPTLALHLPLKSLLKSGGTAAKHADDVSLLPQKNNFGTWFLLLTFAGLILLLQRGMS